ncbi:MAG: ribosome biogenesis GTP-binding protein YihA/YsxC [Eubacteriaceae bacterium]|nr:ribosome biogenesis GTP-binding protein YihA/YsxC [Eubacteriaceae bacterium]
MKVTKAEIVISAVSREQYPEDLLPEIVLLGRSNVGKSSFINTLIHRKNLARTSSQPGKTQTMNFYQINDVFRFVDMPGYGYAKVSKKEREKWGAMIETYLLHRHNLSTIFLLVDSRHIPTEDDQLMYQWLVYYGLNPFVVLTKNDKLSKIRKKKAFDNVAKTLGITDKTRIIPFSAVERTGVDTSWMIIEKYLESEPFGIKNED